MLKGFFTDTKFSGVWLALRLILGWQWLSSGLGKLGNPVWTGDKAGVAVNGFLQGAVAKATGDIPAVKPTYAALLEAVAIPNATLFSYLIVFGEILVGLALILGFTTTFAALMGAFMNFNFMAAGSSSSNPYMFTIAILIIAAGPIAGHYGIDRFIRKYRSKEKEVPQTA